MSVFNDEIQAYIDDPKNHTTWLKEPFDKSACNCDQANQLKQKTLRLGLLLALSYLRATEPPQGMMGNRGHNPGDAHRRWRVRFRRVRSMLGNLKAANGQGAELDSSVVLSLGEAPPAHDAVAVVEQADAEEPGHEPETTTKPESQANGDA